MVRGRAAPVVLRGCAAEAGSALSPEPVAAALRGAARRRLPEAGRRCYGAAARAREQCYSEKKWATWPQVSVLVYRHKVSIDSRPGPYPVSSLHIHRTQSAGGGATSLSCPASIPAPHLRRRLLPHPFVTDGSSVPR
jgi:hypothetical protein